LLLSPGKGGYHIRGCFHIPPESRAGGKGCQERVGSGPFSSIKKKRKKKRPGEGKDRKKKISRPGDHGISSTKGKGGKSKGNGGERGVLKKKGGEKRDERSSAEN